MPTRSRTVSLLTGFVLILTAACGGSGGENESGEGDSGEPDSLTLVLAAAVIGAKEEVATYAVAEQLGYLEEENLTVEIQTADGSTAALQAIASGSGDVTAASALSLVPAVAQGVPVQAFGGLVQNWPYLIGVAPDSDIEKPEDLEGARIGIISLASASNGYTRSVLDLVGLDPDTDAQLIPVGLGPTAAVALESGEVDALALYGGAYADLEANGLELRYLENDPFFSDLFSITWVTTPQQLGERSDTFARFGRAMYKALLFSAENPEAAMRMGYQVFPELLPDSGDAEETIADDTATLMTWIESATPLEGSPEDWPLEWGSISEERWAALQEFIMDSGDLEEEVPLDEVWDSSLVEEMNNFDPTEVIEQARSQ